MHRQNSSLHFKTQKKPEKQKNPIDSLILHHIFHTFVVDKFPCFTQKKPLKPPNRTVPKNPGNASHSQGPITWRPTWTTHRSKPPKSQRDDHLYKKHMSSVQLAKVMNWPLSLFGGVFYSLKRPDRIIPPIPLEIHGNGSSSFWAMLSRL